MDSLSPCTLWLDGKPIAVPEMTLEEFTAAYIELWVHAQVDKQPPPDWLTLLVKK